MTEAPVVESYQKSFERSDKSNEQEANGVKDKGGHQSLTMNSASRNGNNNNNNEGTLRAEYEVNNENSMKNNLMKAENKTIINGFNLLDSFYEKELNRPRVKRDVKQENVNDHTEESEDEDDDDEEEEEDNDDSESTTASEEEGQAHMDIHPVKVINESTKPMSNFDDSPSEQTITKSTEKEIEKNEENSGQPSNQKPELKTIDSISTNTESFETQSTESDLSEDIQSTTESISQELKTLNESLISETSVEHQSDSTQTAINSITEPIIVSEKQSQTSELLLTKVSTPEEFSNENTTDIDSGSTHYPKKVPEHFNDTDFNNDTNIDHNINLKKINQSESELGDKLKIDKSEIDLYSLNKNFSDENQAQEEQTVSEETSNTKNFAENMTQSFDEIIEEKSSSNDENHNKSIPFHSGVSPDLQFNSRNRNKPLNNETIEGMTEALNNTTNDEIEDSFYTTEENQKMDEIPTFFSAVSEVNTESIGSSNTENQFEVRSTSTQIFLLSTESTIQESTPQQIINDYNKSLTFE